jgi:hypothetical protein
MKGLVLISRVLLGAVMALWLALLIASSTTLVLLFGGLLIPKITVRTVLEGWGWTALGLTLVIVWSNAGRGRFGRLFARPAVRVYAWSTLFVVSWIVLFYTVERWRGHRAWQKLESVPGGETLELRGLQPFPVSDAQNFASLPMISNWWEAASAGTNQGPWQRLATRVPDGRGGAWEVQQPVDLEACLQQYVPSTLEAGRSNVVSAAEFLAAWQEFAPEMEQLSEGALRTYARFDLAYDRGMFDTNLGRQTQLFLAIGQAFRLRAVAALRAGKSAAALSDVEQLLSISELVGQEPLLERQRLGLLLAAIQPVWEGIGNRQWSESQLAVLQSSLARPTLLEEYRRAVRKESLLVVDMCEKLFPVRSPTPPLDVTEEAVPRLLLTGMRWLYPTGWLLQNQVGIFQLSRDWREQTVDPEARRVLVDHTRQIARMWVYRPPSLDPFFATFVMPRAGAIGEDAAQRYAYTQSALDLAVTACAIERYRLARRQVPDSLELLVPDWMDAVVPDIIDGRPLRYRRPSDGRYLLYSVGWNQNDDGGRVAVREGELQAWEESPQNRADGDWVWSAIQHQAWRP